ncbi:hypothetical protein HanXRQr2_Chr15g0688971 [Helianthus annuus]|uniref:Uncharacterized protein n=1 Tax=Helianthus annuus TaxID=4232 RepID=A0A9K3DZ51_HELAN|nr:hypothetical protein HanXRQr2_Chr15g0688971 [Helianthus annuus]KAJ0830903.1 hypothetical protein HanPSC8_Chr15g0660811 [Helianthus annuus]
MFYYQFQGIGLCGHGVKVRVGIDGYTNFTNRSLQIHGFTNIMRYKYKVSI